MSFEKILSGYTLKIFFLLLNVQTLEVEGTGTCNDNISYISMEGAPCAAFRGLDCTQMEIFGWSERGQQRLLRNCPESCQSCPTASPTASPTNWCHDDLSYTFSNGFPCKRFKGLNCEELIKGGFFEDASQGYELLKRCPDSCGVCDQMVPSSSPSVSCYDNSKYTNRLGLKCINFIGLQCHRSFVLGLNFQEVQTLIKECPFSCDECYTSAPSKVPSSEPTSNPTPVPTGSPTENCHDDLSYRDPIELPCSRYKHMLLNCNLMQNIFNPPQYKALIKSCPYSCNMCEESLSPSFTPSAGPTEKITTIRCLNNPLFKDGRQGLSCSRYTGIQCPLLVHVGWSKKAVADLLLNCPESCSVCGSTVTSQPSPTPSVSSTSAPQISPTDNPSTKLLSLTPTQECFNKPNYVDRRKGLTCSQYSGIECKLLIYVGWGKKELASLMKNCPESCGLCD